MSITYTWKITGLKTRTEGANQDAVVQTYWTKTGIDENGSEGSFQGATPFTSVDVPEGQFVPFADLSEEAVIEWVKAVVVGHYETHVNNAIAKQIEEKTSPISEAQMPWAPQTTTAVPEPGGH